ncbi:hypothetical protein GLOIN_2v1785090 [Rhizophagus irregularis DAOM 181602=DAOM 197198]|nr:hypothetical protein GLOIN_2v1785090 [Rhizophagus irregularis DAOM 181602=DAOM 197198]
MTTPKAPSVINPDIPPPPLPGPTFTTGSLSLSSDNSGGASAKHSHSVPDNAIDIETTSTHTPGFSPNPTASTGFPVNKVAVITQPPVTNDNSLDSSIHAQTLLTPTTVASQDDKGKYVAFAIPERQLSPNGSAAAIKSAPRKKNSPIESLDPEIFTFKVEALWKALDLPKPYVYLNFSSFDTLEAAKELSVAFCDKGLIWHLPNEAHTLCYVCGRSDCSFSVYSPCPTRKVDDHLNKLYSRFNASPRYSHQDSHQSRDKSNSRSRSRSNSRSRNNPSSSRSNNNNNNINTPCPDIFNRNNQTNNNNTNSRVNVNSSGSTQSPHMPHPNSSTSTSQKLESMMSYNYPNNADLHSSPVNTELYSQDVGWDNEPSYNTSSRSDLPPYTSSSLMDTSPDASFSALDPNFVLSNRHVPLPSS